uniref:NADH-ubiquinone oxidoreductase chain 4 n=1 Tax=Lingula anatina TaxID=7574 RepID=A0A0R7JP56_LINAN|nr:NADH dehydrogenase subunit 4 [Lingula anatina]
MRFSVISTQSFGLWSWGLIPWIASMNSLGLAHLSFLSFFFFLFLIYPSSLSWNLLWLDWGFDYLSLCLICLSCLVIGLSILMSLESSCSEMTKSCGLLLVTLILTFSTSSLLYFYCGFEFSVVPMVYIILRWGSEAVRLVAAGYMVVYTLFSSMPLLWGLACLADKTCETSMLILTKTPFSGYMDSLWWVAMILAFLVKSPLYPFHLWLPKAHVEAPTFGSMILAGVMLKLGTYGLFRVCPIYMTGHHIINSVVIAMGVWGSAYSGLIALRVLDMKEMVAYASVGHMSLVVAGIFSNTTWGWGGAFIMMLSHGLVSSLLFGLVGYMSTYSGSRGFIFNRGWMNIRPWLSVFMFIGCSANMGVPPFPSFLGELGLMTGLGLYNWVNFIVVGISCVLTGAYSLRLYLLTQHGSSPSHLRPIESASNGPAVVSFIAHSIFIILLNFIWVM